MDTAIPNSIPLALKGHRHEQIDILRLLSLASDLIILLVSKGVLLRT